MARTNCISLNDDDNVRFTLDQRAQLDH